MLSTIKRIEPSSPPALGSTPLNTGIMIARWDSGSNPMTTDRAVVVNFLKEVDFGVIEDGTAIGDAIALAGARLQKAEEEIQRRRISLGMADANDVPAGFQIKNKVIILLTDGQNNAGEYAPLKAAELMEAPC